MIQYFLAAILLVGIPFLLYCLWNFARELKPYRSSVVVLPSSSAVPFRAVPISSFKTEPRAIRLQHPSRSAS